MQVNMRREPRTPSKRTYSISWRDEAGLTHSAQVPGVDASGIGIGVQCPTEIRKGTAVYVQADEGYPTGYTTVRHSTRRSGSYIIGLEWDEGSRAAPQTESTNQVTNHYEFLQISPKAQAETIQRVYRFLAARYHPDNPETGDPEKFLLLNQAYDVLSKPESRARYDESLKKEPPQPSTVFESVDFLDGVEGEVNRRLAVLALLYRKCRSNVNSPQVSLLDLEAQMGFPREYLDFTIWYLRSKKLVKQEDNAELTLTCLGVDYVEENFERLPLLRKLLGAGTQSSAGSQAQTGENGPTHAKRVHFLAPGEPLTEKLSDEHGVG